MADNLTEKEQLLYHDIMRAIAELRLTPGRKLTEERLARAFDVNRARVRKVLLVLANEGVVVQEHNRGAFVCKPTKTEALEVFEARRLIECHLARQAQRKISPEDVKHMQAILTQENRALDTHDFAASVRLSGMFHLAIADLAGNTTLSNMLHQFVARSYLVIALYKNREGESCGREDHAAILDVLQGNDEEALQRELNEHFDHILAELDFSRPEKQTPFDTLVNDL